MTKIATMIILAISFLTSAAAQSQTNDDSAQIVSLTGTETAQGTFEPMTNMFYGNTFVLNSLNGSEELETRYFTTSLDYSSAPYCTEVRCEVNSHFSVTGGSWSLVVFRNNAYAGTLYGRVSGGTINVMNNHQGEPNYRKMQVNLKATGGLGRFAERGSANVRGVFEAVTDARSNQTTGSLNFTFGL